MIDQYSYYVFYLGLDPEFFWHAAIADVEHAAENKMAIDGWMANPKTI